VRLREALGEAGYEAAVAAGRVVSLTDAVVRAGTG